MSSYLKGDIVLVPFPFSDLTNSKVRPAIVISNSIVNKTEDIILAQITSNLHGDAFSYNIDDKFLTHTLNGRSEVRCNKLFTTAKSIIRKKVSSLKTEKHRELIAKIVSLLE